MPHPTTPAAVRHPETDQFVALDPAVDYPADDVLVRAYPWAFAPVESSSAVRESVRIERATAEPGQKRTRTKAK